MTGDEYTPEAMMAALRRALAAYHKKPVWRQLQKTGMQRDFSWRHAAQQYVELYRRMTGSA